MAKKKQVKEEKKKKTSVEDKTRKATTGKTKTTKPKISRSAAKKPKATPKSSGRSASAKSTRTKKTTRETPGSPSKAKTTKTRSAAKAPKTRKSTPKRKITKPRVKTTKKSTRKTPTRKKSTSAITTSSPPFTDSISVESSKFEVEPPPGHPHAEPYPPFRKERVLPEAYGDTRVVLLVRDPEWIFSYWEINDQTRIEHDLTQGQHGKTLSLRVYDITHVKFDGANANRYYDVIINDYTNSWYLRIPEVNRRWCVDLGYYHQESGEFVPLARSNAVSPPSGIVSLESGEEWMHVSGEQHEEILRLSGGLNHQDFRGSENVITALSEKIKIRVEQAQGASGALASGRMEEHPQPGKDFWLTVNTDLIVYGATDPSATLTILGKAVPLRDDGAFSIRFSLPDGTRIIPVHATSVDGKFEREIIPRVKKETH